MEKKQKQSAEKLFVRIEKAVKHADSCFLNKKQRSQLTSMRLQLLKPKQQQQQEKAAAVPEQEKRTIAGATMAAAMAAAEKVTVGELKAILSKHGLNTEGLKVPWPNLPKKPICCSS